MVVYDDVSADEKITVYDKGVKRTGADDPDPRPMALPSYETFGEFQVLLRVGDVLIPRLDFVEPLRLECSTSSTASAPGRHPTLTVPRGWR